ncbi:rapid alkalinization factor-like [Miscanthus floridulus]|uniref:rapid alkalinization factor-like n=1 Tax=Miscanthus floridulus TaxID=154761 RepID=UPI00345998CA
MLPPPPRRRAALTVLVVAAVLLAVAGNAQRSAAAASAPVYHDEDDWAADVGYGYGGVAACTGTATGAECAVAARRELGDGGSIGYGALQKDQTPCSYRGASYYNCHPGGAANPYTRGCSAITQCRG